MNNAFTGKRIDQNSVKLKQFRQRERRLNQIGLSVVAFTGKFNWLEYFKTRNETRKSKVGVFTEEEDANSSQTK